MISGMVCERKRTSERVAITIDKSRNMTDPFTNVQIVLTLTSGEIIGVNGKIDTALSSIWLLFEIFNLLSVRIITEFEAMAIHAFMDWLSTELAGLTITTFEEGEEVQVTHIEGSAIAQEICDGKTNTLRTNFPIEGDETNEDH